MSIINKPPEMVKREYELQEPTSLGGHGNGALL
jgi:hypothetical protein